MTSRRAHAGPHTPPVKWRNKILIFSPAHDTRDIYILLDRGWKECSPRWHELKDTWFQMAWCLVRTLCKIKCRWRELFYSSRYYKYPFHYMKCFSVIAYRKVLVSSIPIYSISPTNYFIISALAAETRSLCRDASPHHYKDEADLWASLRHSVDTLYTEYTQLLILNNAKWGWKGGQSN